jgi:hypothetical protein
MKREMPERFFMEGVSEQHIIGMAAGLAMEGFIPTNDITTTENVVRKTLISLVTMPHFQFENIMWESRRNSLQTQSYFDPEWESIHAFAKTTN